MLKNNILGSNVVQEHGDEVLESVIGLLSRDPIAILSSLVKLRKLTLTIRDINICFRILKMTFINL